MLDLFFSPQGDGLLYEILVYGRFFSPLSNYVPDFPSTDSIASLLLHAR